MPLHPRSRSRPFLVTAILLNLSLFITLSIMAPRAYPLHHDTPANFWFAVTGVDLGASRRRLDYFILDRDRFIYSSQYPFAVYPDFPYHTLTVEEAEPQLPAVARELARRAAANDPNDYIAKAYTQWIALPPGPTTSFPPINDLLLCIDQARSESAAHLAPPPGSRQWPPPARYNDFQNGLLHVASAARLYWATFTFELLFFSFLLWFSLWPCIHRQSLHRKLIRIALFPILLYLPTWFGYCNPATPFTIDDASCPALFTHGILYSYTQWGGLLTPLYFFIQDYDTFQFSLLAKLPPFLTVITQGRAVAFADYYQLHASIPLQVLPLDTLLMSLEFLIIASIPIAIIRFRNSRRNRPGFPIEPQNPTAPLTHVAPRE